MLKISISLIVFFIILTVCSNIFAYSMGVELNSSSTKLEANKEYTITASVVENNTGDGISVITSKLKFDENVFDKDSITFTRN